jgi:hypothetical protein
MTRRQTGIVVVMALGVVATLTGLLAALALQDIYHGEPDVTVEWRIVQLAALAIGAFIVSAMVVLGRALRDSARRSVSR